MVFINLTTHFCLSKEAREERVQFYSTFRLTGILCIICNIVLRAVTKNQLMEFCVVFWFYFHLYIIFSGLRENGKLEIYLHVVSPTNHIKCILQQWGMNQWTEYCFFHIILCSLKTKKAIPFRNSVCHVGLFFLSYAYVVMTIQDKLCNQNEVVNLVIAILINHLTDGTWFFTIALSVQWQIGVLAKCTNDSLRRSVANDLVTML